MAKKKTTKKKTTPKSVTSYKGRGRPPMPVSMTSRLREVLGVKACRSKDAAEYAKEAGLDARKATVLDCLCHCLIYWSFHGSAPHMAQLWDRLEGKVPQKVEAKIDGKLGISEAIAAMNLGKEE